MYIDIKEPLPNYMKAINEGKVSGNYTKVEFIREDSNEPVVLKHNVSRMHCRCGIAYYGSMGGEVIHLVNDYIEDFDDFEYLFGDMDLSCYFKDKEDLEKVFDMMLSSGEWEKDGIESTKG